MNGLLVFKLFNVHLHLKINHVMSFEIFELLALRLYKISKNVKSPSFSHVPYPYDPRTSI